MKNIFCLLAFLVSFYSYASPELIDVLDGENIAASGCRGISADRIRGIMYTSGTVVLRDGSRAAVVRKSTDSGVSWATVYQEILPFNVWHSGARDIAVNPLTGSVFSIQRYEDPGRRSHWVVIRSADQGQSWQRVDDYVQFEAPGDHYAYHLAVSPFGKVCVAGQVADSTDWDAQSIHVWTVRCSDDDGLSWSNLDQEEGATSMSVAFGPGGEIYSAGSKDVSADRSYARIKQYDFVRGLWGEIDAYYSEVAWSSALQLRVDAQGSPWLLGTGWVKSPSGGDNQRRWLVRAKDPVTGEFQTLDKFAYSPEAYSEAYDMATSSTGKTYVVGYAQDAAKIYHMAVRVSEDQGASWQTAFLSAGASGRYGYGHNAFTDLEGRVLVCGQVAQSTASGFKSLWSLYRFNN